MDITVSNLQNSSTALSTSIQGAKKAEAEFGEAANNLINSFAAGANVVSGADLSPETLAAASDPITSMVDMKTSQHAYEANLKVFSAVDEMSQELLDILA
jgi:hypothetical protein